MKFLQNDVYVLYLQAIFSLLFQPFSAQGGCNAIGPISFGNLVTPMNIVSGNATDIQFNDWLNTYLIVSDSGDVRVSVCHQLVGMFVEKFSRGRSVSVVVCIYRI